MQYFHSIDKKEPKKLLKTKNKLENLSNSKKLQADSYIRLKITSYSLRILLKSLKHNKMSLKMSTLKI